MEDKNSKSLSLLSSPDCSSKLVLQVLNGLEQLGYKVLSSSQYVTGRNI